MMNKKKWMCISVCGLIIAGYVGFIFTKHNESVAMSDELGDKLKVVTSFSPVYLQTMELVDGLEHIELVNMADSQVGCLHDYVLTTEDAKKLYDADVFVINGMGEESFLEKVYEQNEDLHIIDSSTLWLEHYEELGFDLQLLHEHTEACSHEEHEHTEECSHEEHEHTEECSHEEHEHTEECSHEEHEHTEECSHEEHEHTEECSHEEHEHTEECSHEEHEHTEACGHDHSHGGMNSHIWLSLEGALMQIEEITNQLIELDPAHADVYEANKQEMQVAIETLRADYVSEVNIPVVMVHDSFVYLAEEVGMEVIDTIPEGVYESPSPQAIQSIIDEMKEHEVSVILADARYADLPILNTIQEEVDCTVILLDDMTAERDGSYIERMTQNLEILRGL